MARDRDDDDDYPAERGRGRFEDDDDRPRRRRDDDISEAGGYDSFAGNMVVAIIFAVIGVLCCPCLSIILGAIGLGVCKTPEGKKGSMIMLVAGAFGLIIGIILNVLGVINPNNFR